MDISKPKYLQVMSVSFSQSNKEFLNIFIIVVKNFCENINYSSKDIFFT